MLTEGNYNKLADVMIGLTNADIPKHSEEYMLGFTAGVRAYAYAMVVFLDYQEMENDDFLRDMASFNHRAERIELEVE